MYTTSNVEHQAQHIWCVDDTFNLYLKRWILYFSCFILSDASQQCHSLIKLTSHDGTIQPKIVFILMGEDIKVSIQSIFANSYLDGDIRTQYEADRKRPTFWSLVDLPKNGAVTQRFYVFSAVRLDKLLRKKTFQLPMNLRRHGA